MLKISLVVPIFNNAYLLEDFISETSTVLNSGFNSLELEYIIINDGSNTENSEILRKILVGNPVVRLLELTRNFGQHIALAYGFKEATGNIVVRVNPDLEDPLQVLNSMITCVVDEGFDLAKVVFRERKVRSFSILLSRIFAVLFGKISRFDVDAKEGSMRVMSRRYIDSYNQLKETKRNPQGLDSWMGFKTKKFETDRIMDPANISTYSFGMKFKLAIESMFYSSNRILNFVAVSGFATLVFSIIVLIKGSTYLYYK
jgi:dolichol-phosphate mannosyltransferase